jgi:biotin carboxyl carrier protein
MPEILAPITGSVWEIHVAVGDLVQDGQVVATIESMKLEIPVESDGVGTVDRVLVEIGSPVAEGEPMIVLE